MIFWVVIVVKGSKIVQNDWKFCLLYSRSQEPYIIWLTSVVDRCKMISPGGFFIFSKFGCFRFLGGSMVKICRGEGGGGWASNQRTSTFRGGSWERGGDFFQGRGCNFHIKNKLKSEIFNDKKVYKQKYFFLS